MSVHQTLGEFLAEIDERVEIEGSELVESIGRRFWINKAGFYLESLDSMVISYPVRSAEY